MAEETSSVAEFYRGGRVLVTGATGFVGKALVEKLLRSCPDIEAVYLLIRPKRGKSPQARCTELLNNTVFDRVRTGGLLKKVEAVAGDVMEPGLGLSAQDRKLLTEVVTIVFHSAATVKFNETLVEAVRLNTMGTQAVLDLCKQMIKLQAVIHVSTAYSNADRREVGEEVYPPPADPDAIVQCVKLLKPELVEQLTGPLLALRHPNTYTVTKAMAEAIVARAANQLPIGIVRPSIVTGAWKEPYPGWVDNIAGITGLMMEVGRGTIRSIVCKESNLVDIIPVDIVVDTLIVAAWHSALNRNGSGVPVYNCTSGQLNPITWTEIKALNLKHSRLNPSKYVQFYPDCSYTPSVRVHFVKDLLFHAFPALLMDIVLKLQGSKPIMLKLCQRMRVAAQTGTFFALHEWEFQTGNQRSLARDMNPGDKRLFCTDVTTVDWDQYVAKYMMGIRTFVLKDTLESLPAARTKVNRLWWMTKAAKWFLVLLVIRMFLLR